MPPTQVCADTSTHQTIHVITLEDTFEVNSCKKQILTLKTGSCSGNMGSHPVKEKRVSSSSHRGSTYVSKISDAFRKLIVVELKSIMQLHSFICILIGLGTLVLPHRFYSNSSGYDHFAHEFVRLYGCLTLGIGYLVWCTKDIKDGRLLRALTETFALSYGLQAVAMLRAQLSSPSGHSTLHWLTLSLLTCVSGLYTFCRFARKIKDFELPGFERGE